MKSESKYPRSALRAPRSELHVPSSAFRVPSSAFRAVVLGGSVGGLEALTAILPALPVDFALSVLLVQHLHPSDNGALAGHLDRECALPVIEPCDKEQVERRHVYIAPANYHMLVERDGAISLSVDGKVNWSRPSIDILFKSAARAWGEAVIAVILSGANADGAAGMRAIKAAGGLTMAQDPATAETPVMPQAAIDAGVIDEIMSAADIGRRLVEVGTGKSERGTLPNAEIGTGNGEWGMGSAERGNRNGEWGTGNGERGMGNGEWGMGNGECGTRKSERGMGNGKDQFENGFKIGYKNDSKTENLDRGR